MSTSQPQLASTRNPQPSHKADTDDSLLRIGGLTFEASRGAKKNAGKRPNSSHNPPPLTRSTRAHGPQPGQSGHQARNRNTQKAPGPVTPQAAVPHPRRPPVPPPAQAPQAPRGTLAPKLLPPPHSPPKPIVWAQPASVPKLMLPPKSRPLPQSSLPAPQPLPVPRALPVTRVQVSPLVKGHATDDHKPGTGSETEIKVKSKKKELTPEQKALKALRREERREKRERKKDDHYQLVLSATDATIAVLKRHGLSCAVFGSLACKLYGPFRDPKDVDLLVFQPLSSDPDVRFRLAEETKALIVDMDPSHFYLKLPRDPEAPYRILYYRSAPSGPSCKVDILVPGTMHLPNIPPPLPTPKTSGQGDTSAATNVGSRNYLTTITGIPLVPFSLLLLHKLQGWADHRSALESHKRRKEVQDAADVRRLLQMGGVIVDLARMKPWTNPELFCEEFRQLTKERVKEYCKVFPGRAISWQMLGFETT